LITDEKILITGITGSVAQPIARFLAERNEVWGVARFADSPDGNAVEYVPTTTTTTGGAGAEDDPLSRASLEAAGITTRAIDLGSGDFSALPEDFTYVLHLAWMRADLAQLEQAMRTNVEGPGLLLQHCRRAKAALVMSGMGIYSSNEDPWHAYREDDPIGRGATAYAATSPASKLGIESVARFCARAFDLPITIARLNTFMGTPRTFPAMHIEAVLDHKVMTAPSDPNPHTPIHIDDMLDQLEPLLGAAGSPALITNWCGDEDVTAQEWTAEASRLSGVEGRIEVVPAPGSPAGTRADPARRRSITGPCRTKFTEAYGRLFDEVIAGRSEAS
jgi:nucleoside-diphosphate-sugar epimerase